MPAPLKMLGRVAAQRARGDRPGAGRALVAAAVAGVTTAVLTYKVLRSA